MSKPLDYEQIWGEPNDIDDYRLNIDEDLTVESALEGNPVFDEAHYCPECGEPVHLCKCDLINYGEDLDIECG